MTAIRDMYRITGLSAVAAAGVLWYLWISGAMAAAIWAGAELVVRVTNTNDFQWSRVDTCIAVYPGYVVKYRDGSVKRYPNPPYEIELIRARDNAAEGRQR